MVCLRKWFVPVVAVSVVLTAGVGSPTTWAASPETAPAELTMAIEAIEAAANAQDLDQVSALYSAGFQGPDGFTREQYLSTLGEFWQQYSTLTYDVELLSWEAEGDVLVAETLTTVTGSQSVTDRNITLTAEVRSRQRFEAGQVVSQEILAEESRLASGSAPPTVQVQLPESVAPGDNFNFDAIVEEPIGDGLLLGIALDEGVTANDFLTPRPLELELLSAGGLFKVGKAPVKADQRWISSVLLGADGLVIDTRRLTIEE